MRIRSLAFILTFVPCLTLMATPSSLLFGQEPDAPQQEASSQETPEQKQEQPAEQKNDQPPKEEDAKAPAEEKTDTKQDDAANQAKEAEQPKKEQPKPEPPKPEEPRKLPNIGSTSTPQLPGQPWRVHDLLRPRPRKVTPPNADVTTAAPGDAVVLFDGIDLNGWAHYIREENSTTLIEPQWNVKDGYFEITRGHGDLYTIENFGDVQLHIEWQIPENIKGSSQGRGNSGVKFLGLYEVQILDSFNNLTYADGQAGAIYGQYPPAVNASKAPGQWQTYDIIFEMPKFEGEKLITPGYLTVLHNGVLVHHRRELAGVTGMASPGRYRPHPPAGPIMLQDHGNPIRFRNVWARHLDRN